MNPLEAEELRTNVLYRDVYVCRDRDGFWTYFSELRDGRWIVEYAPRIERDGLDALVIGPFGTRARLPGFIGAGDVSRVVATVTESPIPEPLWVLQWAQLVSATSLPLSALEPLTELPWPFMEDVRYRLRYDASIVGSVEYYGSGPVFRLESGEEIPLDEVRDSLVPDRSTIQLDNPNPRDN